MFHLSNKTRKRHSLVVLSLVASLLIPAATATAQEDSEVSFVGAGWGHGVGLTQYGAYGAARDGWTADQITGHFYVGSAIGTMGAGGLAEKGNLWVNLERDRSTIELIARETNLAPAEPVVVTRGEETWELGKNHRLLITWNSGAGTCGLVLKDASGATTETPTDGVCNVDITWDGWVEKPSRKIEIEGCYNTDWNLATSVQRPCQYARGDLHLRVGPGGMDLSVEMDIDDYVYGISEMPYYWGESGGLEALKAQALAARSYARNLQLARGTPGSANNLCNAWCHVRDTTWDQRYVGWGHVGIGIDDWIEAVSTTAGQVITHPQAPWGNVVRAYYSSSSGGATENVEEVWTFNPVPYLATVEDAWSLDPNLNGNASWTVTRSANSVASSVGLDTLTGVAVIERNTSTSAHTVRFTGTQGGMVVNIDKTGKWVDDRFGLKSIYFDVVFGEVGATPPFTDITGSVHYDDIVYIEDLGITQGCNPPSNTHYCPTGLVTRGEMAAFLVRALDLTDEGGKDWFGDDDASVFESDINKLAAAGITAGCNSTGTNFCPDVRLSRGEMAAFLVRSFSFTDAGTGDWFGDDDGSRFENDIDRLKVAGVTLGCNPPDNTNYCPTDTVRRDQMASFLARALRGLA